MSETPLADAVRRRIAELGISQRKYAERVGLSSSHVNQIVKGGIALPSADVRRRIAEDLGVSHLDVLIMAGEITRQEVEQSGISQRTEPDHVPMAILNKIRQVDEWTLPRRRYVITAIDQMLDLERSVQAVNEGSD